MILNQTKEGGTILYNTEDFIGLVSGYGSGNYPKIGKGSSHQLAINPYREATPGILAPSFTNSSLTNASTNVSAVINSAAIDRISTQPNVWLIESGAKIHQITGVAGTPGTTISITAPFPKTIASTGTTGAHAHSAFTGEDIIFFTISSTNYILYSYNDNTDGDVGRVILAPTGVADFNDSYFSGLAGGAALDKTMPHPMIIGDDQVLYIADGINLRSVDSTGVAANNTTVVPPGFEIRCFSKNSTSKHLIIFIDRSKASTSSSTAKGESYALFWDYASQKADFTYPLNDNEVTAAINWNGIIACWTTGRPSEFANIGYRSKLQIFEGGRFVPKFHFSDTSPIYGGVEVEETMIIWNSSGNIYSYGSPYDDFPTAINKIAAGSGTTTGYVRSLNGSDLYISSGSGASCERIVNGATYSSSAVWKGIVAEPILPSKKIAKLESVEVGFFGSATGGLTITLTLDTDYGNATTTILNALGTVTAGNQTIYRNLDSSSNPLPFFQAIKPQVSYGAGSGNGAAPKISFIKIYFSYAEINY